jgi:hypothetical protein
LDGNETHSKTPENIYPPFMATKICVIWGLNRVASEDYVQGPAEIPDDFAKQL